MTDITRVRLWAILGGLISILISIILNGAYRVILPGTAFVGVLLFISIPHYVSLIMLFKKKYIVNIIANFIVFLCCAFSLRANIGIITGIFLICSFLLNTYLLKEKELLELVATFSSPIQFISVGHSLPIFKVNIFLIISFFFVLYKLVAA